MLRLAVSLPVLGPSLAYAGALYAVGRNASILDIRSPWWVATMAVILLLSPMYHGYVIRSVIRLEKRDDRLEGGWMPAIAAFPRLFVGQLLIAVGVTLGTLVLILPGVYLGIRAVLYKQCIVLDGMAPTAAVRESFRRTSEGRTAAIAGAALGGFYGLAVGIDAALTLVGRGALEAALSVAASGFLLAALNSLLTDAYLSGWTKHPMERTGGTS